MDFIYRPSLDAAFIRAKPGYKQEPGFLSVYVGDYHNLEFTDDGALGAIYVHNVVERLRMRPTLDNVLVDTIGALDASIKHENSEHIESIAKVYHRLVGTPHPFYRGIDHG